MASIMTKDGEEYIFSANLNVLAAIQSHYGSMTTALAKTAVVEELLWIAAAMINEDLACRGSRERLTPLSLGRKLDGRDIEPLTEAVIEALNESLGAGNIKKKRPKTEKRKWFFRLRKSEILPS